MFKVALIVLLAGLAVELVLRSPEGGGGAVGQPVLAPQCQATMTCGP